ncbi:Cd(II)/Pb(II)-responsive transcriptional regulator [Alcaligenes sp. Marseille-Q7550]
MKIGELAQKSHCNTETIRYYEKVGLLPEPERSEGNYRQYRAMHLERLRFIRNCRSLDMTHEEIRALLAHMDGPAQDCEPVNSLLDEHIEHVAVRIRELEHLQEQLKELRHRCGQAGGLEHCGILPGPGDRDPDRAPGPTTHLG